MSAGPRTVLGIDVGTSSLKCVVLDESGAARATATEGYPTSSPSAGWAEQDPADWIDALRLAIGTLADQDAAGLRGLACVGVCSAAHIPVLLDERDRVIRPAILWSDQRSGEEAQALSAGHRLLLENVARNQATCTWTLPQLMWLCRHEPACFARTRTLLSSKDYLIFHLSGQAAMDAGSAAATLMLDMGGRRWSADLVALGGLPESALPAVHEALDIVGTISGPAADSLGLPAGIPIIAGALDSAAELVGCGILEPRDGSMIRVGSSGGVMVMDANPSYFDGIITYPYVTEKMFYHQAGTNSGATSLRWIKDMFGFLGDGVGKRITYEFLDDLVASTPPGAAGLLFHPYLQGERAPYWDPDLRASFTGIDLTHGWGHFVRAVMEGVAFSLKDCLELFVRHGFGVDRAVITGGITKSAVWSQIVANVLGMDLHVVRHGDSAFGVALMASVGGGLFTDLRGAVDACVRHDSTIRPDAGALFDYEAAFRTYGKIARRLQV